MKPYLIEEREAAERSPNHTWTPDCGAAYKHRVQWRKDKRRACVAQFNAGHDLRNKQ